MELWIHLAFYPYSEHVTSSIFVCIYGYCTQNGNRGGFVIKPYSDPRLWLGISSGCWGVRTRSSVGLHLPFFVSQQEFKCNKNGLWRRQTKREKDSRRQHWFNRGKVIGWTVFKKVYYRLKRLYFNNTIITIKFFVCVGKPFECFIWTSE